jgi:hypothetical protein
MECSSELFDIGHPDPLAVTFNAAFVPYPPLNPFVFIAKETGNFWQGKCSI